MPVVQEGQRRSLHTGMTFHAVLPGHPKSNPSWVECGANLGKAKRCGETGQEGVRVRAVSWPSTQTSDTVPHPTFPLPPDKNRLHHEAFPMEQPPQLGEISLSINHAIDTHPVSLLLGWGGVGGLRSCCSPNSSFFSSAPISWFLSFFSCVSVLPFTPHRTWQTGAAAWEPDRGSQRKYQLPSLVQHVTISESTPKSWVGDTCSFTSSPSMHLQSQQSLWQLYQASRLV